MEIQCKISIDPLANPIFYSHIPLNKKPRDLTDKITKIKDDKRMLATVVEPHDIWKSNQYGTPEIKPEIYKSVYGKEHNDKYLSTLAINPEIAGKWNNMRRTQISEYSNALHNKGVFINPRFLSC